MEHENGHNCACSHHNHSEQADSGCDCHTHAALHCEEVQILHWIAENGSIPAANFVMTNSHSSDCRAVALSLVLLKQASDTMQEVKSRCKTLISLQHKDLISFHDDRPVSEETERLYRESAVFKYFEETVAEGSAMPGFLFDTAVLNMGCLVLTELGERALKA